MARTLAIPALVASVLLAGTARADDDCLVPMEDWQPRSAVADLAAARGWQVRRIRIDDGCYQILGRDAAGRSIEVTLDPATLAVVEIEQDEDGEDEGHGDGHDAGEGRGGPPD
jgi:hypothetical protein